MVAHPQHRSPDEIDAELRQLTALTRDARANVRRLMAAITTHTRRTDELLAERHHATTVAVLAEARDALDRATPDDL